MEMSRPREWDVAWGYMPEAKSQMSRIYFSLPKKSPNTVHTESLAPRIAFAKHPAPVGFYFIYV